MTQSYSYLTEVQWGGTRTPPEWRSYHSGEITLGCDGDLPEFLDRAPASPQEIIEAALAFTAWLAEDECRGLWIKTAANEMSGPALDPIQERRPIMALTARVTLTPLASRSSDGTKFVEERALTVPAPTLDDIARFRGDPIVAREGQHLGPLPALGILPFVGPDGDLPDGPHFTALPDWDDNAFHRDLTYLALFDGCHLSAVLPLVASSPADLDSLRWQQAALLEPWVPTVLLLARVKRLRDHARSTFGAAAPGDDTIDELESAAARALPDAEASPLPPFVRSWNLASPYSRVAESVWDKLSSIVVKRWANSAPSEGHDRMIKWAVQHGYPPSELYWEVSRLSWKAGARTGPSRRRILRRVLRLTREL